MTNPKAQQSLSNLSRALERLEEALSEPATNSLVVDGTIQRFEFVIKLFWKTFKRFLAYEGVEAKTPRESLRQAYRVEWISDEAAWLEMLHDRNRTSHVYDEEMAEAIYARIRRNFPVLKRALRLLEKRYVKNGDGEAQA